jgi:hypothetical protein
MTNPLRQQMVARAVQQTQNGKMAITLRNVAMFLPGPTGFDPKLKAQVDFELDAEDLAPYLPAPTPAVETPSLAERLADVEIEFVPPTPVEPPEVRYQRLQNRMLELERERVDLRFTYDTAIRDEINARNELDKIARVFMNGFVRISPDELLKQHAASEAETRRKIAAGEIPKPHRVNTVGPSALDRYMAAQRGGNPGFAGRGYARGAQPANKRLMFDPKALPGSGLPQLKEPV